MFWCKFSAVKTIIYFDKYKSNLLLSIRLNNNNNSICTLFFIFQNGFDHKSFLEGDSQEGSRFGSSIANVGDINNDGFNGEVIFFFFFFFLVQKVLTKKEFKKLVEEANSMNITTMQRRASIPNCVIYHFYPIITIRQWHWVVCYNPVSNMVFVLALNKHKFEENSLPSYDIYFSFRCCHRCTLRRR